MWTTENKTTENNEIKANFKKVKQELELDQRVIEDFLQEAITMREFDHSNVLSIFGVSIHETKPCVVLPFMSNGDLKNYLQQNYKVSIGDFAAFVAFIGVRQHTPKYPRTII